jgi:hypothetical protein
MRIRSLVVVLLSSATLFACGGASVDGEGAKGPDPWADYKGTFATKGESHATAKPESKSKAKAEPGEQEAPKKVASKGTIKGESLSSIGVDALADASKGAFKSKVVSSNVVVGSQYEQVQVQLKGASVQIIRPAASPDPNGPSVSAPKARNGELAKGESGWYDEDADVLVVVAAKKKPTAQRALGTMLKR